MLRNKILIILALVFVACAKKETEIWYCPMHKNYQTDHPGECPICGMKLIKKMPATRLPGEAAHADHGAISGGNPPDAVGESASVATQALTIPTEKQQMLGVLTAKPQVRKLALTLRLPAQVDYDPDLYTALVEYRQIRGQGASMPEGISGGVLASAAKLRVKQLGLSDDEINQFANSETALSRLLTGNAAGKALIALQVSEGEIGLIHKGQHVVVTAGSSTGRKFSGRVTGIGTLVDAKRRAFTVRALVSDRAQALHAQMFVSAEIALDAGKGLSLPRSAVFNTGRREIVFVKRSETEFVPVEVKILGGNDDFVIVQGRTRVKTAKDGVHASTIISGIGENDEIVVSSAFLLDSEARIRLEDYK